MDFTPEQFAKVLLQRNPQDHRTLQPMFSKVMYLNQPTRERFFSTLVSFPSFCKDLLTFVLETLQVDPLNNPHEYVFGRMVECPLFHRWIRESGEDELVMKVWVGLVSVIDRLFPSFFSDINKSPPSIKAIQYEFSAFPWVLLSLYEILLALPPSFKTSTWIQLVPSELANRAGKKLSNANQFFLSRRQNLSEGLTEQQYQDITRVATCFVTLGGFASGLPISIFTKIALDGHIGRSWFGCGATATATLEEEGTEAKTKCTELKSGDEMKACSRCKSVRYCSEEHQKADWKRHKQQCVAPKWSF